MRLSRSGFLAIEDFAENLRAPRIRHRLVPSPVVRLQTQKSSLYILRRDAFNVGRQTVLLNQSGEMFAVRCQAEKQFCVERQVFRRGSLAIHPLLLLTPKQFHFVKPHHHFTIERQGRGRAKNDLGRRTPILPLAGCLHGLNKSESAGGQGEFPLWPALISRSRHILQPEKAGGISDEKVLQIRHVGWSE
jgi:hypothetical protein